MRHRYNLCIRVTGSRRGSVYGTGIIQMGRCTAQILFNCVIGVGVRHRYCSNRCEARILFKWVGVGHRYCANV